MVTVVQNMCMSKNDRVGTRRRALKHVIDTDSRWKGNESAFARDSKTAQSQISDMIRGPKSFGEKVARRIERDAQLDTGILDREPGDNVAEPMIRYGLPISPDAVDMGREWDKLREPIRTQLLTLVQMLVNTQGGGDQPRPGRGKRRSGDRPDSRQ